MTRILIGFFVVFIMLGCTTTQKSSVVYEEYKPAQIQKPLHVKEVTVKTVPKQVLPTSGIIKGSISKLMHSDGLWNYEVKSKDTSNQKLSHAKFTHPKKLASKGDFVYAIINDGKLKEIYLIKKANYKSKATKKRYKTKTVQKTKADKRTKKHQRLSVPIVESISLE